MTPPIPVRQLAHARGLPLPAHQSGGAAGLDLQAAVAEPVVIERGARQLVPTGLVLELPAGFEAQVRPRSGLALNHGVTVLNAPGTIDSDYRGEISVLLINHGQSPFEVTRGARIAQLVIARVERAALEAAVDIAPSTRGAGGFGSTGMEGEPRA